MPSREIRVPPDMQAAWDKSAKENLLSGDGAAPSNPPFIDKIRDLENALMVLDVTLFCLAASGNIDPLFMGQVRAAAEAYKHATSEESMLVENRCKKDFTREAKTAD